ECDKQAQSKRARHAVAMERPTPAIENEFLERPQTPEFLQRMAVRCDAFQPALRGLRLTPREAALCRFRRLPTVIHDRPPNQRVRLRPMAVSQPSAVKYHAGSFKLDQRGRNVGDHP